MRTLFKIMIAVGLMGTSISMLGNNALANADDKAMAKQTPMENKSVTPQGFLLPYIDPARGRKLFASKGCVVCHSINGIGGEDAPSLVSGEMKAVMNPFEFAARMWRGAATMITMQEDELGEQIEFSGSELADMIAFIHSREEQKNFTEDDIPERIKKLMGHLSDGDAAPETKKHD